MNTPELFYAVAIINAGLLLATLVLLVAQITNAPFWKKTHKHVKKHGVVYAFWVTTLSTLASLWLSEIAGITPCFLCWVQRVFMYPLPLFFGLKIYKKTKYFPAALAVLTALVLILGMKVLPAEYMSLYGWYAFTLAIPLAIYLVFKEFKAFSEKRFGFWMAVVGAIVAGYHYLLQRIAFLQQTIPCSVDASCNTMYLGYWGFYSIPVMAFTGFVVAAFVIWQTKK